MYCHANITWSLFPNKTQQKLRRREEGEEEEERKKKEEEEEYIFLRYGGIIQEHSIQQQY